MCATTSSTRARVSSSMRTRSVAQKYLPERHSPVAAFLSRSDSMFWYVKNVATHAVPSESSTLTAEFSSRGFHSPEAQCSASIHIDLIVVGICSLAPPLREAAEHGLGRKPHSPFSTVFCLNQSRSLIAFSHLKCRCSTSKDQGKTAPSNSLNRRSNQARDTRIGKQSELALEIPLDEPTPEYQRLKSLDRCQLIT